MGLNESDALCKLTLSICVWFHPHWEDLKNPLSENHEEVFWDNLTGEYSFTHKDSQYRAWLIKAESHGNLQLYFFVAQNDQVNSNVLKIKKIVSDPTDYIDQLCDSALDTDARCASLPRVWGLNGELVAFHSQRFGASNLTLNLGYEAIVNRIAYANFAGSEQYLSEIEIEPSGIASQLRFRRNGFFPDFFGAKVTLSKVSQGETPWLDRYFKLYTIAQGSCMLGK